MTLICGLLALTLLAAVCILTHHHSQAEQAWTDERRELLSSHDEKEQEWTVERRQMLSAFAQERRLREDAWAEDRRAWTEERSELLNRIQRPEHVPLRSLENFVIPEPEPDELDLVGTIAEPKDE